VAAVLGGKDFRQLQLRAAGFTERAIYFYSADPELG
jgi:hypothetical protein